MSKIIAGNWKMNGSRESLKIMSEALKELKTDNTVIICPPFTFLGENDSKISFGAQDVSAHESGAYTGEISAKMISDTGAKFVIVGHSERRQYHNESNKLVAQKAIAALGAGLTPIICVGETREQKESGQTLEIIETQVRESLPENASSAIIVAYEPVWAIGTGLVPTMDDIANVHAHIAKTLKSLGFGGTPILYGGSVKGSNAAEIMAIDYVGGVLVGGASLKPDDFLPIINA